MGIIIKSSAKKIVMDTIMHPVTVVLKNGASIQCWSPVLWKTGPMFLDKDRTEHPAWTGSKQVRDDAAQQIKKFADRYDFVSNAPPKPAAADSDAANDASAPSLKGARRR